MGTIMSDGYDRQMWKTFPRGIYDGPFGRNNNMFQVGLSINYVDGAFYAGCTNNVEGERQAEYLIYMSEKRETDTIGSPSAHTRLSQASFLYQTGSKRTEISDPALYATEWLSHIVRATTALTYVVGFCSAPSRKLFASRSGHFASLENVCLLGRVPVGTHVCMLFA